MPLFCDLFIMIKTMEYNVLIKNKLKTEVS